MFDIRAATLRIAAASSFRSEAPSIAKVISFARLYPGWHYGAGVPAPEKRVGRAIAYIMFFNGLGLDETDAFPGVDGEVMLTAYKGRHYLQLTLEANDRITAVYQINGDDVFYDEGLSNQDAISWIMDVVSKIEETECATSGLFTQGILTTELENLRSLSSKTAPTAAGYRSFRRNVRSRQAVAFVNTFANTTQAPPPNHPFFGSLMNPNYMKSAA